MGFANLDDDDVALGDASGADDGFVGAFEAFDRDDGKVFDDDGLADVHAGDLTRERETEVDVFFFAVGQGALGRQQALFGHAAAQTQGAFDDVDAFFVNLFDDAAEDGVGAAGDHAAQNAQAAFVESAIAPDRVVRYASGHGDVADFVFMAKLDEPSKLAEFEPEDLVDLFFDVFVGHALYGECRDGNAELARGVDEQERHTPSTCDQAELVDVAGLHGRRRYSRCRIHSLQLSIAKKR